jgi:hypothetical protein
VRNERAGKRRRRRINGWKEKREDEKEIVFSSEENSFLKIFLYFVFYLNYSNKTRFLDVLFYR